MPAQTFTGAPCVCQHRLERCDQRCVADMLGTTFYIACLKLTGRRCLVVGAGDVGLEKIDGLLASGAGVHVIARDVSPAVRELAEAGDVDLTEREFRPGDLEGHFLAIAATSDTETNIAVFEEAERRAMLCNVVDVPPLCSFILPAIVRSGPIAIAISTAGASPALAKRMKREIADLYGDDHADLAAILNDVRGWAKATLPTFAARRDFLGASGRGDPDPIALLGAGARDGGERLVAERQAAADRTPAAT